MCSPGTRASSRRRWSASPNPVYGEIVKACVVPRPGATLGPDDVREWVSPRLAKFKVPTEVEVWETLPRNPNGKVTKSLLRSPA